MNNAVEIEGLRKAFRNFTLKDVTFSFPQGYIMGLVGEKWRLEDHDDPPGPEHDYARRRRGPRVRHGQHQGRAAHQARHRRRVRRIFFADSWRVSDVERAVKGFYSRWSGQAYGRYLKSFDLPADKRVKELSRGMKLKLMLAVAMSNEARLLILDEPTSGLDPVARDELLGILSAYISDGEKSVIFSAHITSDLEKIADFITLIHNGAVFYTGTKDDLLESYRIVKGGPRDLTDRLRESMVGLERNSTGFSGLVAASKLKNPPVGIVSEAPSIDDILVRISAGDGNRE